MSQIRVFSLKSFILMCHSMYVLFMAAYTNHVASKGGGGVKVMYMFVYIGGSGGLANVYVAFFAPNFSRISI